jgi:uncharacterized membrane protein
MMFNEFTNGIFKVLKRLSVGNSVVLAIVYTLGHFVIALSTVRLITGANWFDAGLTAAIEPLLNGVWFYVLHKYLAKRIAKRLK